MGIPIDGLVQILTNVPIHERGTWVHPKIAWHLAMWCSGEVEERAIEMLENWRLGHQLAHPEIPKSLGRGPDSRWPEGPRAGAPGAGDPLRILPRLRADD